MALNRARATTILKLLEKVKTSDTTRTTFPKKPSAKDISTNIFLPRVSCAFS